MLNRDRKRGRVLEPGKKIVKTSKDTNIAPGECLTWRHL